MRTLQKNKQQMYYALQQGRTEIPELDSEGHIRTIVVDGETVNVGSGEYQISYKLPISFMANISFGGGEIRAEEYGIDVTNYDAIIVMEKGSIPITETSLIWYQSDLGYIDADHTIIDPKTADYRVVAIKPTLNHFKAVLSRITK